MFSLALFAFALCASVQGRAVNINNTWVLPEEGFPVFYRYFRDRISWYEADAVCQFHHANLVTVDTTAQYDAVRAYLKELDISSAVWVGLIRSNPNGAFTWTDYSRLSSEGYWSSAPDPQAAPLCAAADPAADYRWEARACGGPTVASFICELALPQWAIGNEGCMLKALPPAVTVLYLPESAAVQLTADCGLAGVKRVQCTGNVKGEDLLRDLSCAVSDESSSNSSVGPSSATSTVTSENIFTDQDVINEASTEENTTTEHEDDINQSSTTKPVSLISTDTLNRIFGNKQNEVYMNKNINLDDSFNNNLQSNDIPKIADSNNYLSNDLSEKLEDEKNKQHKMMHDEYSRHGNFETIFTQPTDHFVPPLVMAKAKLSDDMTVLSLEEKHAQQLAEHRYSKLLNEPDHAFGLMTSTIAPKSSSESQTFMTDKPSTTTTQSITTKDDIKKDILKTIVPKKYNDKYNGLKSKTFKAIEMNKTSKIEKSTEVYSTSTTEKATTEPAVKYVNDAYSDSSEDQPTIDLTVIIKEPGVENNGKSNLNYSDEIPKIEIIQNDTSISEPEIKLENPVKSSGEITQEISVKLPTKSIHNLSLNHQVIKITILKEDNSSGKPAVFEVTTRIPESNDNNFSPLHTTLEDKSAKDNITVSHIMSTETSPSGEISQTSTDSIITTKLVDIITSTYAHTTEKPDFNKNVSSKLTEISIIGSTQATFSLSPATNVTETDDKSFSFDTNTTTTNIQESTDKDPEEIDTESDVLLESNTTDTSQTIDDFQSPLLSAANEPLHRPNRSRRPQPPPNRNKYNLFRILG